MEHGIWIPGTLDEPEVRIPHRTQRYPDRTGSDGPPSASLGKDELFPQPFLFLPAHITRSRCPLVPVRGAGKKETGSTTYFCG